jgi:hypothetical protein
VKPLKKEVRRVRKVRYLMRVKKSKRVDERWISQSKISQSVDEVGE